MSVSTKTAILFIGLPYTGKTTLIQHLLETYPGEAIFADAIFTRTVPPSQSSLNRWLQEGPRLVAHIRDIIQQSTNEHFFIELGTMQAAPRNELMRWCRKQGYSVIPVWCQCNDAEVLQQRHQDRVEEIGKGRRSGAKIDITLDTLYERICAAFEEPASPEGFIEIDTSKCLEACLDALRQLMD